MANKWLIGAAWIVASTLSMGTVATTPQAQPSAKPPVSARVAVAANFAMAAKKLAADYSRHSGYRITISSASTGKLYAQIHHGAPFDVLLAADARTPRLLADEGFADATTRHDYATGRLVLWSRDPALIQDGEALLRKESIGKLAIANPALAPYGEAARETLNYVRRWDELQPHLVMGENVGQATQFVVTGAAPLGLLPLSLVQEANRQHRGSSWEVPANWHAPIVQSAVLLKHGQRNPAARGFLKYLQSPAAQKRIRTFGYD